ncbi:Genetic suppressor element 1, partial [Ophiophagus hannah]
MRSKTFSRKKRKKFLSTFGKAPLGFPDSSRPSRLLNSGILKSSYLQSAREKEGKKEKERKRGGAERRRRKRRKEIKERRKEGGREGGREGRRNRGSTLSYKYFSSIGTFTTIPHQILGYAGRNGPTGEFPWPEGQ